MIKGAIRAASLALFGILSGWLCAESIVRIWFPSHGALVTMNDYRDEERGKFARYDSLLGWDGKENADDEFIWEDCRHHVRQNRFGYRGAEHEVSKKRGRRFVVLGDSYVWGFGVANEQIFTSVMEQRSAGAVEMINMGVSGFGTDQELLLWTRKGRPWAPDEVLLLVDVYTDLWDNMFDRRYDYPKPYFGMGANDSLVLRNVPVPPRGSPWRGPRQEVDAQKDSWVQHVAARSAFAGLLLNAGMRSERVRRYLESHDLIEARRAGYDWEYPFYAVHPDGETELAWRTLFALLRRLNNDVRASGARLTVVIVPTITQVYPEIWEEFKQHVGQEIAADLDPLAPNERITSWCDRNRVKVIDLLPGLREAGRSNANLYFPINLHWTADGHGIVSRILSKELNIK